MHVLTGFRRRTRDLVPALLVTAAVLLVFEHWKHFDATDLALLLLILVAAMVHLFTRTSPQGEGQARHIPEGGRKRRPF